MSFNKVKSLGKKVFSKNVAKRVIKLHPAAKMVLDLKNTTTQDRLDAASDVILSEVVDRLNAGAKSEDVLYSILGSVIDRMEEKGQLDKEDIRESLYLLTEIYR